MREIFKVEGLQVGRSGKRILGDLSFSVNKGEIFAILGPSGAGKTTLLRVLSCLEKPTLGKIFYRGIDLLAARGKNLLAMRRRMAMVFQEGEVFDARVFDNVAYGLRIRGVEEREIRVRVGEVLKIVGLGGYEERYARSLSGGEKQRLTFAMATVVNPEVLLFDEPTANLDPINETLVDEMIKRINSLGITIILATHKQGEALTLADRVGIMNNGEFEQLGTPEEVFYRPATSFVARFVGMENIFEGELISMEGDYSLVVVDGMKLMVSNCEGRAGDRVMLCIRPEEIMILRDDVPKNRRYPNVVTGRIVGMSPQGKALVRIIMDTGDNNLVVDLPRHAVKVMKLDVGKKVRASLKPESCHIITG
jgi:tungstate transport system ATP-binding protein